MTPARTAMIALLVLLAGCRMPVQVPEILIQPTSTAVQPLVETSAAGNGNPAAPNAVIQSQNQEAPLRFSLPQPGPAPISLWRPPLYDTPWALGPHDHFYFKRPIAADKVNWPVADYRYGGIFFSSDIVHTGIDIPTPTGTPVLAAESGRVVWAGYGLYSGTNDPDDPYGLAVTIRHDFGYKGQRIYTVYAHMSKLSVVNGQEVQAGDQVGLVGTTGLTTGPHLHFEVRMERNSYFATLNPELWLAPPQGWGVLAGRIQNPNGSMMTEQDVTVRNLDTGQKWSVRTYGNQAVNSDPYFGENLVLSDLPAGHYRVTVEHQEEPMEGEIDIRPGAVSYFTFRGKLAIDTSLPDEPVLEAVLEGNHP